MSHIPEALRDPLVNRSTAFTMGERAKLGLVGRPPAAVETLDEQARRVWAQLQRKQTDLGRYAWRSTEPAENTDPDRLPGALPDDAAPVARPRRHPVGPPAPTEHSRHVTACRTCGV